MLWASRLGDTSFIRNKRADPSPLAEKNILWEIGTNYREKPGEAAKMIKIDETDRRILRILQRKGRISNADLAQEANVSSSACHRRVQRLEAEGLIRDYVALLDPRHLDRRSTVFVEVTLTSQADDILHAFEKAVRNVPDVLECHLMAGKADYILKVVAADTDHFAQIHRRLVALPGVQTMQSSFAMRTVFKTTALPV
jgi:Lrp/AsnC family transcriptional regulator, leucine-responsive regulatory protein